LSFTACVWIGMVMMSMMSSTSITSMSGVVLMSTITSGSALPPLPTVIAMRILPRASAAGERARRGFRDEADLHDRGALARGHDASHRLVTRVLVGANVDLGLRHLHRDFLQPLEEGLRVLHVLEPPEHVPVLVHRDHDVLGLGLGGDVALVGK